MVGFIKNKKSSLIAGLDIGSSAIRLAVGQVAGNDDHGGLDLQILSASEAISEGMHRGSVRSIEDVVSAVSACLERAERTAGVPLESVWLGVSGLNIASQQSKGVVAVSKTDSEISEEDVKRAIEAARTISTPLNYDVLHVLPRIFSVDGQNGIRDPIGMTGIRLEVDAQIILGLSSQIKNLTKAVYRSGLDIEDLVLSVLADAEASLAPRQKELGVVVVNLGSSTTSMVAFEEGDLLHTAVLPMGSENITKDVALGLRTSIEVAERVKLEYGNCNSEIISKKDEFDLFDFGAPEHEIVRHKFLGEIIEARAEEILSTVDQELKKIQRSGLLPAGVVFVGGGAKLPGLIELARKTMRLPASLGYPLNIVSVTDKVNDLGYTTAIGLVKWGSVMQYGGRSVQNKRQYVGKSVSYLKKVFKMFTP